MEEKKFIRKKNWGVNILGLKCPDCGAILREKRLIERRDGIFLCADCNIYVKKEDAKV